MSAGALGAAVPVTRISDWDEAQAFFVDYLQFTVDWYDKPTAGSPMYARIRRDTVVLDLSEHDDDGAFGSVTWIDVTDVEAFRDDLGTREYRSVSPVIERGGPAGPQVELVDPFGNVLRFHQPD